MTAPLNIVFYCSLRFYRIFFAGPMLMIIGTIFALIIPIVTYGCSITCLVMSITKRHTHKTTYAIVINIIALMLALANSVLGVMLQMGLITL